MCFAAPTDALSVMWAFERSHMQPVGSRHGWSSRTSGSRCGARRILDMAAPSGRQPRAGERGATWVECSPIEWPL